MFAVEYKLDLDIIESLLKGNKTVNDQNNNKWTALIWAVRQDLPDVVGLLLSYGAAVDKKTIENYAPVGIATDKLKKAAEADKDIYANMADMLEQKNIY